MRRSEADNEARLGLRLLARGLVTIREFNELQERWLNSDGTSEAELRKRTLTNLYNQRPTWHANADDTLDQAVHDAYGWLADLDDENILARLLGLSLERAGHTEGR